MNITKYEKLLIDTFYEYPIPGYIKQTELNKLDLMLCYEEIKNYSYELIKTGRVNIQVDSYGTGIPILFDGRYEHALAEIITNNEDNVIKTHCMLTLSILYVILKYKV